MNPGVALVRAYLQLNGYFTVTEQSVVRAAQDGTFEEVTDLDVLALRFPHAANLVSRGRRGTADDLRLPVDPELDVPDDCMDLLIGEVKEGKPRINDALRSREALTTALARFGCADDADLPSLVGQLRSAGWARIKEGVAGIPCRIRLVAFGHGESGRRGDHTVVSIRAAADYVRQYIDREHEVLRPASVHDPVLGVLHLLRKLS